MMKSYKLTDAGLKILNGRNFETEEYVCFTSINPVAQAIRDNIVTGPGLVPGIAVASICLQAQAYAKYIHSRSLLLHTSRSRTRTKSRTSLQSAFDTNSRNDLQTRRRSCQQPMQRGRLRQSPRIPSRHSLCID